MMRNPKYQRGEKTMSGKRTGVRSPKRSQVYCHCGRPAVLRNGKEISEKLRDGEKVYVCSNFPACNSFVLAYPDTLKPMGTLAGLELRRLRYEAHREFDKLHQTGLMSRKQAYQWLAYVVSAPISHAHIGHLEEYYCKRVIEESKKFLQRRQERCMNKTTWKGGGCNVGTDSPRASAS